MPLLHASVALGIAEATVEDLVQLAKGGKRQERASLPMRESEIFRSELARIEGDLRAASAYHQKQSESHWRRALAGTSDDDRLLMDGIQSTVWVTATCVDVAAACFALAGSSAIYESSPFQRRMRDLHVAAQHITVQQRRYVDIGAVRLS